MSSRPSCSECGSNNVYVRVSSGELVCRRCGYVGESESGRKEKSKTYIGKPKQEEEDILESLELPEEDDSENESEGGLEKHLREVYGFD